MAGGRRCGRQVSFRVDVQPVERCVTGVTSRVLIIPPRISQITGSSSARGIPHIWRYADVDSFARALSALSLPAWILSLRRDGERRA